MLPSILPSILPTMLPTVLPTVLPKEYVAFAEAFARCREEARAAHRAAQPEAAEAEARAEGDARNIWILKPVGSSRGRGMSLLNDISGVSYGEVKPAVSTRAVCTRAVSKHISEL